MIALLFVLKQKIVMMTLLMMLKDVLILLTMVKIKTGKRPLPIGKNKIVIGLLKDELGGKIMEEFCARREKNICILMNGYNDDDYDKEKIINKKAKGTKSCVIKRRLMFENYTDSLFNDKIILKSQQRLKATIIKRTQRKSIRLH